MLHEHFAKTSAAKFGQDGKPHEISKGRVAGFKGGTADEDGVMDKKKIGDGAFQVAADPRILTIGRVFGAIIGRESKALGNITVGQLNQMGDGCDIIFRSRSYRWRNGFILHRSCSGALNKFKNLRQKRLRRA